MPAKSIAQRRLFAIAEKDPEALNPENAGLANLPHKTLHDFAATSEKGLPKHAPATHFADGNNGHWMAAAFAHNKGGLHRATNTPAGQKIPEKKITAALHSKDPHKVHMAQAAKNAR